MNQVQRILLVGNPEQPHSAAFQRAAALAIASCTPLHIAILLEPFMTYSLLEGELKEQVRKSIINEQRRVWGKEVQDLIDKGVHATCSVVWTENLRKEIIHHVKEIQPVMLLKDIHREPILRRAFVTPIDWYLLRECPAPIHLVKDALHPRPRVVVAAVDLTDPDAQYSGINDQIITAGINLATQCTAEFQLLYVCDNSNVYMSSNGEAAADWASIVEELRAAMHHSFVDLAERHNIPQAQRYFIIDQPIRGISEFAQRQRADVVVMGRVHRKILDKWIGSTTEAVLYQLSSSVLAIRSQNDELDY